MRKFVYLVAAVAIAAAPSIATAKTKASHGAKAHHAKAAKVEKKPENPNENTFRLFNSIFAGK